ncbi:MAG TPA: phosphatase PAP2 family protein [Aquabacterium sp.]|uniref:phosphatase PAP2 family protein n=1 Tax=Aquabacterium sp. TaxID=1872578 RepID=UPI002E2EFE23|nr:phosphatase PAP2 family protein [Aquabacterium sp.]HEX5356635.1 phosphatase PAP2 family protein [Aquabacterium sp.]
MLWPILLMGLAAWGFMEIAGEVLEGDAHTVDLWILHQLRTGDQGLRPIGPLWLQEAIRDLTALGSPVVLVLTVGAVWGYMVMAGQRAMSWLALGASCGGLLMAYALKSVFSRARPDAVFHATVASGYSFPSGHAMMSAIVYLTLAALLARLVPRARLRWYVMGTAAALTGLVGLSRVYLGVHWASDVAAGWAAGAAWALLCWLLAQRLQLGQESKP